jgi:hypothetical protein
MRTASVKMVAMKQVITPIQAISLVTGIFSCYTEAERHRKKSSALAREDAITKFRG